MRNFTKDALAYVSVPGLAASLLLVAPGATQAQTDILHACYMPETGVMYLIKLPGLPDTCRSKDHVQIAFRTVSSDDGQTVSAEPPPDAGPGVVKSLNALDGDLTLTGTGGTTISDNGVDVIEINTFSGDHADLTNVLPDQHHTPYTDAMAVVAMGLKSNDNSLNHDRYTDAEAVAAVGTVGDGHSLNAADGDPMDVVFVDNDGNVGIGTASPASKFDLLGNARITGTVLVANPGNAQPALFASTDGTGAALLASAGAGPAGLFTIDDAGNSRPAVQAVTAGGGAALEASTKGSGVAGRFINLNPGNTSAALFASTSGDGPIAVLQHSGVTRAQIHNDGTIESLSGGFKFPDGSIQTSAAIGSNVTIVSQTSSIVFGPVAIALSCPSGKVISGGFRWENDGGHTYQAYPESSIMFGERFVVTGVNTGATQKLTVHAVCIS